MAFWSIASLLLFSLFLLLILGTVFLGPIRIDFISQWKSNRGRGEVQIQPWPGWLGLRVLLGRGAVHSFWRIGHGSWRHFRFRSEEKELSVDLESDLSLLEFTDRMRTLWKRRTDLRMAFGWAEQSIELQTVEGDLIYGFSDPALTGEVFAALAILQTTVAERYDLRAYPDFMDEHLEGRCRFGFVLRPTTLVGLGVREVLKRQMSRETRAQREVRG